ncbi:hypothetical protein OUZ56_012577 [Daphnia magna]|uniref:Uncharacterized protein n=1 Tax=Daphnia magna TaxID=35525 RepID=A0ABQ9Z4L9_9CRUS|nr:hypothetical protein OUZ56_012577 [Daphnia magna]
MGKVSASVLDSPWKKAAKMKNLVRRGGKPLEQIVSWMLEVDAHHSNWLINFKKRNFASGPYQIRHLTTAFLLNFAILIRLLYGKKDHFEILDHPRHVLHSLSLPAAMPSGMGEGQMVKKGPKLQSSFPTA